MSAYVWLSLGFLSSWRTACIDQEKLEVAFLEARDEYFGEGKGSAHSVPLGDIENRKVNH